MHATLSMFSGLPQEWNTKVMKMHLKQIKISAAIWPSSKIKELLHSPHLPQQTK